MPRFAYERGGARYDRREQRRDCASTHAIFGWDTIKEAEKYTAKAEPTAIGRKRDALARCALE
jgi:hypothetical protein